MPGRSIATRLALGTLAVVLLCLVPVFLVARADQWASLVDGKGQAATMVARTLAESVGPGLAFDDDKTEREPLEAVLHNEEVLAVRVDPAGARPAVVLQRPRVTALGVPTGEALKYSLRTVDGAERLEVHAPVDLDGERLGDLSVAVSLAREHEKHAASLWQVLGALLGVALALVAVVLVLFRALVTRRLVAVVQTTQRIAQGQRVSTGAGGDDEVGALAHAIDGMAAHIWRRQDDVQQQHAALLDERQQAAQKLQEARDAALALARAKTEFLATMSHELRTPMNGIIGMTRLLTATHLDPEQQDYVEMIRASSEGLFAITSDILDFSKLDAGKVELERVGFDVQDVLDEVLAAMAGAAGARHLPLAAWCANDVPPLLVGDPPRLRQVLLNLVSNAIKFTEAGSVTLEATFADAQATFTVTDSGCGISPDAQARLFTPFTQADSSTTRRYGGTGLGLAIVKRLVELMRGTVTLRSSPAGSVFTVQVPLQRVDTPAPPLLAGRAVAIAAGHPVHARSLEAHLVRAGATVRLVASPEGLLPGELAVVPLEWAPALRAHQGVLGCLVDARVGVMPWPGVFQVSLPLRRQAVVSELGRVLGLALPSSPADELPRFEGARVLVAEDNVINQRVVSGLLERLGCVAHVVGDGRQAITAALAERYELVLMDCQMPVLDGLEATRELRTHEHLEDLPVIALTANSSPEDRAACLAAGMDGFLSKPLRLETLAQQLSLRLRQRSRPDWQVDATNGGR